MALSANTIRDQYLITPGVRETYDVYQSSTIYMGGMVCINSSGYAIAATDASGNKFVGVAAEKVDNSSGADGELTVGVYMNGVWEFTHASAAVTDLMAIAYVTDDDTVNIDDGTTYSIKVGKVINLKRNASTNAYLATHVNVDITGCPFNTGEELGGNIASGGYGNPIVLRYDSVPAGATTTILTMPFKARVVDAWSVNTSGNGLTWTLTDGSSDIVPAVTVAASDKDIDRAAQIDDAKSDLAAAGTLKVTTNGSNGVVDLYVVLLRIA